MRISCIADPVHAELAINLTYDPTSSAKSRHLAATLDTACMHAKLLAWIESTALEEQFPCSSPDHNLPPEVATAGRHACPKKSRMSYSQADS